MSSMGKNGLGNKVSDLSDLLNNDDVNIGPSSEAEGNTDLNTEPFNHEEGRARVRDSVFIVESPQNINEFIQQIRNLPGYIVIPEKLGKDGVFSVYTTDKDGKQNEVIQGDNKTCKMTSPIDPQILNAYINSNNGKTITVNKCKDIKVAQQLMKTCEENKPPIKIVFSQAVLDNFDSWDRAKYFKQPEVKDAEVLLKTEAEKKTRP